MATDHASSSCWSLCIADGITPHLSVRDLFPDVFGLVTSMDLVAGLAASSLCLIHMDEMEVPIPIAEIG